MKHFTRHCALLLLTLITTVCTFGVDVQHIKKLGKTSAFKASLSRQLETFSLINNNAKVLEVFLPNQHAVKLCVNLQKTDGHNLLLTGKILGTVNGQFYIRLEEDKLSGNIIFDNHYEAYEFYSDNSGLAYLKKADLHDIACIPGAQVALENNNKSIVKKTKMISPAKTSGAYDLQSLPGAAGCVLLDFDGHLVTGTVFNTGGANIWATASGMTEAEIEETWAKISEDYRPFNINITTSEAVFNTYSVKKSQRCVFTKSTEISPQPGAFGVTDRGSFTRDDTPNFVFMLGADWGGETASHEIGHSLGLTHDGQIAPSSEYYNGHDDWAPIMGFPYTKAVTQWSKGEYSNSNNKQDDLLIISTIVGYRNDDHGNDFNSSTALSILPTGSVSIKTGIIEQTADVDFFKFTCTTGKINLNINTVQRYGNLDVLVRLYNVSTGNLLGTFDDATLNTTINLCLAAGTYCISVTGTGKGDPATNGYSNYASLGSYSISGTHTASPSAPVNLNYYNLTPTSCIIAWSAPSGQVTGYKLYQHLPTAIVTPTTATSVILSNLQPGVGYAFSVAAYNECGETRSTSIGFTAPTPLEAPTNLIANSITSTGCALSWSASQGNITGYKIYQGNNYLKSVSTTNTTVTLSPSTTYTLTVRAYNNSIESPPSNSVSVTTLDLIPPGAPTNLQASSIASTGCSLSWTASTGIVTAYRIYKDGTQLLTTSSTNATITGLTPATAYTFLVKGYNNSGESGASNSVTVPTSNVTIPAPPTNLRIISGSGTSRTFAWNVPPGLVTGYYIYVNIGASNLAKIPLTSPTYTFASATGTFNFYVTAYNNIGESSASNSLTVVMGAGTRMPTVDIEAIPVSLPVTVYFNRSEDKLIVNGLTSFDGIIYDLAGRKLREFSADESGHNTVAGLVFGMYIVHLRTKDQLIVKRIVIE